MNTIKTIVVTATLIAVGYGANIVLNKPIANVPQSEDGFWDVPDAGASDDALANRPDLDFPSFDSGASNPDNPFATRSAKSDPTVTFPTNGDTTSAESLVKTNADRAREAREKANPFAASNNFAANESSPPNFATQTNPDAPSRTIPTWAPSPNAVEVPPLQPPPQGSLTQRAGTPAAADTWNGNQGHLISPVSHDSSPTSAVSPQPIPFEATWQNAQTMIASGELSNALYTLSTLYGHSGLTNGQSERLVTLLDQLAGSVIFSTSHTMQSAFVANGGESLASVAESLQLTPEFLMLVNGVSSPVLQPGQSLKVVQGPFRGELSRQHRELTLFLGPCYAGRFSVEIGRDYPPQVTVFTVTEKAGPRDYVDSTTGATTLAGSEDNPYGMHWIGLSAAAATGPPMGLHSVGHAVDASDTRGCVSVSQADARDLQAILSIGAEIRVVP